MTRTEIAEARIKALVKKHDRYLKLARQASTEAMQERYHDLADLTEEQIVEVELGELHVYRGIVR